LIPADPTPWIHVVAAAVTDAAGRVLIAQRPAGKHMAGGWEFPGGKLEPGEDRAAGLERELHEELGISIEPPLRPLIRVRHAYPTREVLLDIWVVRHFHGEPRGLDGQALRWCTPDELAHADLLPADAPIVAALRLPERLQQTVNPHYEVNAELKVRDARLQGVFCADADEAAAATRAGADFVAMKNVLADAELAALCAAVAVPVYARGIGLERAWSLGASGVNEMEAEPGSRLEIA
jgi:mutator protein MutT